MRGQDWQFTRAEIPSSVMMEQATVSLDAGFIAVDECLVHSRDCCSDDFAAFRPRFQLGDSLRRCDASTNLS